MVHKLGFGLAVIRAWLHFLDMMGAGDIPSETEDERGEAWLFYEGLRGDWF